MKIKVFDKHNYKAFFEASEEFGGYVYMIERWIKSKEVTLPCYTIFGHDEEGNIHVKYELPNQGYWTPLSKVHLDAMNDYI